MAAVQGTVPFKLSSKHGRNVNVNKAQTKATWTLNAKGGYSYLTSPLADHDSCILQVGGSGHARLGVTSEVPGTTNFDHKTDSSAQHLLLRQKKSFTRWRVSRDGGSVTASELDKTLTTHKWRVQGDVVTVTVEILFGDIHFEICESSTEQCFNTRYGKNLKLACRKRRISLRENSRSNRCSADRCLLPGEIIILQLQPLRDANWVSCNVSLSNCSAEELQENSNKSMKLVPVKRVKHAGDLQLQVVKEEVHFNYLMQTGSMGLSEVDVHKPIFLHLDLFRMKLKVRSLLPINTSLSPYLRIISTSEENLSQDSNMDSNRDDDYCMLTQQPIEHATESQTLGPISDNYLAMVNGVNSVSGFSNDTHMPDPDDTEPKTLDVD